MEKKTTFTLILLVLTLVSGVAFGQYYKSQTADDNNIHNAPVRLLDNYCKYFSIVDGKKVPLVDMDKFDKSKLSGYIAENDLPPGAIRVKEGLGSLDEIISSWPDPQKSYPVDIDKHRVVYYAITQYPTFKTRYGNIENAKVQQIWDFETGESLGLNVMGKPSTDYRGPNELNNKTNDLSE